VKPNSPGEYKIAGIPGKTYSVTVLGKKYDVPHSMLVRKYQSGNVFGGYFFPFLWESVTFRLSCVLRLGRAARR
jgi:hypothetical protein